MTNADQLFHSLISESSYMYIFFTLFDQIWEIWLLFLVILSGYSFDTDIEWMYHI